MSEPEESDESRWIDDHAGPVVRPYAVTRGRARPVTGKFDLISLVSTTRAVSTRDAGLGPEHLAIVALCDRTLSVAEVAAHLDLPLGTVRVLLGDLLERRLVRVIEPRPAPVLTDDGIFEQVINGLRAL
ncbi:DUF742 domain-containing protein [Plantactinospora sp. S1510]|uniref:DUF742 domain-containing protein n=1 Tax=Plantactinospora alkalitolerans TaxID=2789879 RepID=A0ABS0H4J5_9ACTN|nr:DUF742 domain-containing protein [Plantactinospora alkalitolerans]MBF9133383.1 DUF742 domain-containing protein [Plantactinospora alkalitolerans]